MIVLFQRGADCLSIQQSWYSAVHRRYLLHCDQFSVPPTQISLEKGHWVDHQPVSSVADGGVITFLSPGTEDYVDLARTILVVRAKVTKPDGANLGAAEKVRYFFIVNTSFPNINFFPNLFKVGVVNNFLHSLFKQVDVFLKGKQVTQATGTYAYRAYLETLLNYGPSAKDSQLTAALYYKDTAGKMDIADPTTAGAAGNAGLRARYVFSKASGTVEMTGPIFSDIFMTERLLLSYVDLKVILNRSSDEFCLMASEDDADFRVKLTDAYFKIRKVKVNPSNSVAHEIALKKGPAI